MFGRSSWITACVFLATLPASLAFSQVVEIHQELRWAIVPQGSAEVQSIGDLLTAKLSSNAHIQLVERAQVEKVLEEAELQALVAANGGSSRARLSRLLKADRLIVLAVSPISPKRLSVTISESNLGARLQQQDVTLVTESVADIASFVDDCRERFASGIEQVVGVAPLVPENISHQYDYLSDTYHALMKGMLARRPGIATIELDEAREIRRELAIVGEARLADRLTPLLLSGSYLVESPNVRFKFVIHKNGKSPTTLEKTVALDDVDSLFQEVSAQHLLNSPSHEPPVARREQFKWLVSEAERFSQLGLPSRAASMREAALLLAPDADEERLRLLADYQQFFSRRPPGLNAPESSDDDEFLSSVKASVSAYVVSLRHAEHMIVGRRVHRDRAAELILRHQAMKLVYAFPYIYVTDDTEQSHRVGKEILSLAEVAEHEFLDRVLPIIPQLEYVPRTPHSISYANLKLGVRRSYLRRVDESRVTLERLADMHKYLADVIQDHDEVSYDLMNALVPPRTWHAKHQVVTDEEWRSFLTDVAGIDKQVSSLLGKFGLMMLHDQNLTSATADQKTLWTKDAREWLSAWAALPGRGREGEPVYERVERFLTKLEPQARRTPHRHKLPEKPADWATNPKTWKYWGYPPMLGRIRFSPLQLRHEGSQSASLKSRSLNFCRGNLEVDFLWTSTEVMVLRNDEIVESIVTEDTFDDVKFDGKYIWTVSKTDGIRVYATNGKLQGQLDDTSGLLPHDASLILAVVAPGRVCVLGTLRPYNRTWCAVAQLRQGKLEYRIFHEAKKLPTESKERKSHGDPDLVFAPCWLHLLDQGEQQAPLLLVGRDRTTTHERSHPLAIDTGDWSVRVYDQVVGSYQFKSHSFFSRRGELLKNYKFYVTHLAREGTNWSNGKNWKHICTNMHNAGHLAGWLVEHDGYIYAPGRKWYRINSDTMEWESLIAGTLPNEWQNFEWYGASSRYGLLGYQRPSGSNVGGLVQITIADEHVPSLDLTDD